MASNSNEVRTRKRTEKGKAFARVDSVRGQKYDSSLLSIEDEVQLSTEMLYIITVWECSEKGERRDKDGQIERHRTTGGKKHS